MIKNKISEERWEDTQNKELKHRIHSSIAEFIYLN
jgi:hypothetical protein